MGEPKTESTSQTEWLKAHIKDVSYIVRSLEDENTKAVIIQGNPGTGKTTLALLSATTAQERTGANVYFTTPQVQNTWGARPSQDRTGLVYRKLPSDASIAQNQSNIIVVDELSRRNPEPSGGWEKYKNLPNTKFILVTHPGNPNLNNWKKLFDNRNTTQIDI